MSTHEPSYITPACAAELKAELDDTLYHLRPRMAMVAAWTAIAGETGNEDYQFARKVLHELNDHIRYLKGRLATAEVVDPAAQETIAEGHILFGAVVGYRLVDGRERTIRLLGVDEHDEGRGIISYTSPLGRALLHHRQGDRVSYDTPNGTREVDILSVSYPPLG